KSIEIPDSKIYPSLKSLEAIDIVFKDTTHRPATYFIQNIQNLLNFLDINLKNEIHQKNQLVQGLKDELLNHWNMDDPPLGQIAYIFKNNEVNIEIKRMIRQTKTKLVILLSPLGINYANDIVQEIEKITNDDIRIELAIARTKEILDEFESIDFSRPNIRLSECIWINNSYIIRDEEIMLDISHRGKTNFALLTNDKLLVDYIDSCWNNTQCCIRTNPYDIELKVY
ncbi:MAG: hypothetical protein OEZ01_02185, partial [Candidatus Heimdallarchaeota archaeon]|nr:hypothetical protein [Candidatus Heimdallarchaeota archaeon]